MFVTNTSEPGFIQLGLADTQPMSNKSSVVVVEFRLLDLNRKTEFAPVWGSINEDIVPITMTGASLGVNGNKIFIPLITR